MNIIWQSMTGLGAMAWNHGDTPLVIPATRHHHDQKTGKRAALKAEESALGKRSFSSIQERHRSLSIG